MMAIETTIATTVKTIPPDWKNPKAAPVLLQ
jgi:hypothetical protein